MSHTVSHTVASSESVDSAAAASRAVGPRAGHGHARGASARRCSATLPAASCRSSSSAWRSAPCLRARQNLGLVFEWWQQQTWQPCRSLCKCCWQGANSIAIWHVCGYASHAGLHIMIDWTLCRHAAQQAPQGTGLLKTCTRTTSAARLADCICAEERWQH